MISKIENQKMGFEEYIISFCIFEWTLLFICMLKKHTNNIFPPVCFYLIFSHSSDYQQTYAYLNWISLISKIKYHILSHVFHLILPFVKKCIQLGIICCFSINQVVILQIVFLVNNFLFVFIGWEWSPAMTFTVLQKHSLHGHSLVTASWILLLGTSITWQGNNDEALNNAACGCHMWGWCGEILNFS